MKVKVIGKVIEKPLRVLQMGAANVGVGGRSTIAFNLAMHMDSEKIVNDFLISQRMNTVYEDEINKRGGQNVYVEHPDSPSPHDELTKIIQTVSSIKKNKYDIVHIHADEAIEAAKQVFYARLAGVQNIFIHGHSTKSNDGSFLRRSEFKACQTIVNSKNYIKLAPSLEAAVTLTGNNNQARNVKIINNGIDVDQYIYDANIRSRMRVQLGLNPSDFVIGCVARFSEEKNHIFLLRAFKDVLQRNQFARLLLVGSGNLESHIKNEATKLGIVDRIIFLGNRMDVPELLQAMDVFILPSLREGLGIVNIEAQAAGLPCIVSTGIPKEAKLTKDFIFLSLDAPISEWSNAMLQYKSFVRKNNKECIVNAGYDISKSAKMVQELYFSKINQKK